MVEVQQKGASLSTVNGCPETTDFQSTSPKAATSSGTGIFDKISLDNPYLAAGGGLIILGGGLNILRKGVSLLSQFAYRQMLVDLEIRNNDKSYSWFLNWMSNYKNTRSRQLSVQTSYTQHNNGSITTGFNFIPGTGNHFLKYRNKWFYVKRERSERIHDSGQPMETVTVTTLYKDRFLLASILDEARTIAMKMSEGKTVVFKSWGQDWRPFGQPRRKRLIDSVVLDENLNSMILKDVQEFLESGNWYHNRGIPYRRGYLLYGPPGSGKTSYISALAGELDYNIAILNISEPNLTDDRLAYLMNNIPERTILLLEDIDAAFNTKREKSGDYTMGITFSGLLNALDGLTSAEEVITFMTTNHPERLDPALLRPGRVDFKVLIDNATDYQIKEMFLKFYDNEIDKSEIFLKKYHELKLSHVSTAQLQGLFVQFKEGPDEAIRNVEMLRQNNYS